ncbi:MAG: hypothetical protein IJA11_03200 [Oscillospiraceae bacterium]|nr:hypothetical protein [Oscillospiraceae bacterium]
MKNRLNIALLTIWFVGAVVCVVNWLTFINIPSFILPVIPAFCIQLLLCRVTKNGWLRALPVLPVLGLLGIAGFYFVRDSGWDRLAALIFAIAAIAPAVGTAAGWLVWWLTGRKKRNSSTEEC